MSNVTDLDSVTIGSKLVVRGTFDTQILTVVGETSKHWKVDSGAKVRKSNLTFAGSTDYDRRQVAPLDSARGQAWLDQRALRMALQGVQNRAKNLTTQAVHVQRVLHGEGRPGPLDDLLEAVQRLLTIANED